MSTLILLHPATNERLLLEITQSSRTALEVSLRRVSFKGALTAMRQWAPLLHDAIGRHRETLYEDMLSGIASDLLLVRPDRVEPRAVKRRPKSYQLMTKPRRLMRVSKSRLQK